MTDTPTEALAFWQTRAEDLREMLRQHDEACPHKAGADRLAEALEALTHSDCDHHWCQDARKALRLHDAAKEAERG